MSHPSLSGNYCGDTQRLGDARLLVEPDFQAPRLPLGPTHTNYHAFREFTLTLGTELIMLYIIFLPLEHRIRPFWNVMLMAALGYYIGWWLPWPIFGYHAPNELSQIDHLTATVLSLAGVVCAWKHFPKPHHYERTS